VRLQAVEEELEKRIDAIETRLKSRAHRNRSRFIGRCLEIQEQPAKEAGEIGYMANMLVQATLPHSKQSGNHFKRTNGSITIELMSSSKGLPYGTYPRLLMAWITTQVRRNEGPKIHLGESLTQFMAKLGLCATGGRWGNISSLKDQAARLFSSDIVVWDERNNAGQMQKLSVAEEYVWWERANNAQEGTFESWVTLSDRFFKVLKKNPIPIDMRAIRALKQSPLALDIYAWATYRASYLPRRTPIKWGSLQQQFGSGYPETARGKRNFKIKFLEALRKVGTVYPDLRSSVYDDGKHLVLMPMSSHVPKSKKAS
jgi:Plasmid encoded RepA protein